MCFISQSRSGSNQINILDLVTNWNIINELSSRVSHYLNALGSACDLTQRVGCHLKETFRWQISVWPSFQKSKEIDLYASAVCFKQNSLFSVTSTNTGKLFHAKFFSSTHLSCLYSIISDIVHRGYCISLQGMILRTDDITCKLNMLVKALS